jgi:hypothetical protein
MKTYVICQESQRLSASCCGRAAELDPLCSLTPLRAKRNTQTHLFDLEEN